MFYSMRLCFLTICVIGKRSLHDRYPILECSRFYSCHVRLTRHILAMLSVELSRWYPFWSWLFSLRLFYSQWSIWWSFGDILPNGLKSTFGCPNTPLSIFSVKRLILHFRSFHFGFLLDGCRNLFICRVFIFFLVMVSNIVLKIICGA